MQIKVADKLKFYGGSIYKIEDIAFKNNDSGDWICVVTLVNERGEKEDYPVDVILSLLRTLDFYPLQLEDSINEMRKKRYVPFSSSSC